MYTKVRTQFGKDVAPALKDESADVRNVRGASYLNNLYERVHINGLDNVVTLFLRCTVAPTCHSS